MSDDLLGDRVKAALTRIGVTEEAVSKWIGAECGCDERRRKLNALHSWARSAVSEIVVKAKRALARIMED